MYRTIDSALWTDPKVKDLEPDAKLLFLYLITNPHTHVSGIYYILKTTIQTETKLTGKGIDRVSDILSRARLCRFDANLSLVWVCRMMEYQARGEKARKSAAHHIIEDLHKSPLIMEFLREYPDVQREIKPEILHTLTIGYPAQDQVATPDSLFPIPDSLFLNPEQEGSAASPSIAPVLDFGEFGQVKMTQEQFDKLNQRLNGAADQYIADLDLYSQTKPKEFREYKNHYAVVLQWHRRDMKEGKTRGGQLGRNSSNSGASGQGKLNRPATLRKRD